jgi:hypothetical protein
MEESEDAVKKRSSFAIVVGHPSFSPYPSSPGGTLKPRKMMEINLGSGEMR